MTHYLAEFIVHLCYASGRFLMTKMVTNQGCQSIPAHTIVLWKVEAVEENSYLVVLTENLIAKKLTIETAETIEIYESYHDAFLCGGSIFGSCCMTTTNFIEDASCIPYYYNV